MPCTPDAVVLIYYAGHGCCMGGQVHWIPVDGREGEASTYLTLSQTRFLFTFFLKLVFPLPHDSCYRRKLLSAGTGICFYCMHRGMYMNSYVQSMIDWHGTKLACCASMIAVVHFKNSQTVQKSSNWGSV